MFIVGIVFIYPFLIINIIPQITKYANYVKTLITHLDKLLKICHNSLNQTQRTKMEFNEDLIKEEFGSIENFLRTHEFTRNTYEALKRKTGKSFIVGSKAHQLKELLKEKNYIK